MIYSPQAVANTLLDFGSSSNNWISPMKIQKLVYYAHGWHLAIENAPLINEPVLAWQYGPVIESLYRDFCESSGTHIRDRASILRRGSNGDLELYEPTVPQQDDAYKLLVRIWEVYGTYTATQLSNISHEESTPWHQVASKYGARLSFGLTIPDEIICEYFLRLAA